MDMHNNIDLVRKSLGCSCGEGEGQYVTNASNTAKANGVRGQARLDKFADQSRSASSGIVDRGAFAKPSC
jgi:hypothetical protein